MIFYSTNSTSGKIGRIIDTTLNNIIINMNIMFGGKFKNVTIINNFGNQKYLIKTQYYGKRINSFEKVLFEINFFIPDITIF